MANPKVKPGSTVDGWCTKCKLVLAHTVEAMVDSKITRVHCNTCRGQHAYRASAPATRPASGGAKTAGKPAARSKVEKAPKRSEYETLLRGRTAASARPYATTERFAPGEVISHASFGLGVVTGERDSVKIDVHFADGPKVLMHGR
jgi:hypothetical protein